MKKLLTLASILVVTFAVSACSSPAPVENETISLPGTSTDSGTSSEPIEGPAVVEEEFDKNKADAMFVSMMIPHHYQGIEMNVLADRNTTNTDILSLASTQTSTHEGEIAILEKYFWDWSLPYYQGDANAKGAAHYAPRESEQPKFVLVHGGDGVDHIDNNYLVDDNPIYQEGYPVSDWRLMEGMLSEREMVALFNARDADFDRLWLEGMIMHHEAAIAMAKMHQMDGIHPTLLSLSEQIIIGQEAEVEIMRALLAELDG